MRLAILATDPLQFAKSAFPTYTPVLAQYHTDGKGASCASGGTPSEPAGRGSRDEFLPGPALGSLFVAGAVLALGWLVLVSPAEQVDELGLAITAGVTLALGAMLVLASRRMPDWWFHGVGAFGTILITAGVAFTGDGASVAALFYVWVGLFVGSFSARGAAAAHVAFAAVMYAAVLIAEQPGMPAAGWWVVIIGMTAMTCLFVWTLRARVRELVRQMSGASRIDLVTGLLNRRGFQEYLDSELARARRSGAKVSMVVGDVDHFGELVRRLGSDAAELALERTGGALEQAKRKMDAAARIGGQEFAFVLPDTDEHGAYVVAERLRAGVAEDTADLQMPVNVSFGVACFPEHGETGEELLTAACQAVAAAKQLGRDRTVMHSPEIGAILAERRGRADRESEVHLATILILAEALDIRDTGTARHCQSVGRFASAMAAELGLPAGAMERVRLAGVLHDVGKIGVSDAILRKPGPLTSEEWEEMRRHPEIGARILTTTAFDDIRGWVLSHHERPDGAGYPSGLKGDEISLESRILAVADAYEAMTADRPYRAAIGVEAAKKELRVNAGTQFDRRVANAFLEWLERRPPGEREPSATAIELGVGQPRTSSVPPLNEE